MSISQLTRLGQNLARQFGPSISIQEVSTRLAQEAFALKNTTPIDEIWLNNMSVFRELLQTSPNSLLSTSELTPLEKHKREFWADYSKKQKKTSLIAQKALEELWKNNPSPGTVIDLGCGNTDLIPQLLEKQWETIAVDNSPEVLFHLLKTLSSLNLIDENKKLKLELEPMETYLFPKEVSLIIAKSSFPYSDPNHFENLWNKIHSSLKIGGYVAGNVFVRPLDLQKETSGRQNGMWYADKQIIEALLKNNDYEKIHLEQQSFRWDKEASSIDFIGRKR